MSLKSDNAPLRIVRIDMDNGWGVSYSSVVRGEQYRCGAFIYDGDTPRTVAGKLRALAKSIDDTNPRKGDVPQ